MSVPVPDLLPVLRQFNPWWRGERLVELPTWRRAAFHEVASWVTAPPARRALLLTGARQIGKTTLFLQTIESLLEQGVPAARILYATFDHPLLRLAGPDAILNLWREIEPDHGGPEYLFLDEIQSVRDWQTWLKHQVDFHPHRRIAVTGSAVPLVEQGQESGVGRWHTVRLATLSFYEYLQLKGIAAPDLPPVRSLAHLFDWPEARFAAVGADARPLVGHFHEYLLRGGFPQSALIASIPQAQKLLREDIVDKVLKRDMTALFGVRRILELEQTFLYLCLHDGGLLDLPALCGSLQVKKPTAQNFITLLEATHLIHRLPPFGYGKEVLRGRFKIYLADAAIAPAILLKGKSLLEDPVGLGVAAETAFFNHVFARYYRQNIHFAYWRDRKGHEVDLIASVEGRLVPFEVKYRAQATGPADLKALTLFCAARDLDRAYAITKDPADFGILTSAGTSSPPRKILKIPAPLACHWLGRMEVESAATQNQP